METVKKRCCLTVVGKDYPVPLKAIDVQVAIRGFIANVISTLKYTNTDTNPIEAVFEFPLDDQSAVYHFEAHIEDRTVIAECQEKQQAKETYQNAIDSGYTAALLEEDDTSSDIFRCTVGNIPPAVDVIIKFAYVIELSLTPDGAVQFVLPTQLNPRYNPSVAAGGSEHPPEFVYFAPGVDQPYTFSFSASVFSSGKIASVMAPTGKDELSVVIGSTGNEAEVKLTKNFVADHDLSFVIKYEQQNTPHVIIEKGDTQKDGVLRQDVLMLNFFPQLSESEFSSNHEFIFVIDRSGSMDGSRIESAKQALLVFLKSLPPGCYFNIIGFGFTFVLLFPEGSREYSEESLKIACDYQSTLAADMGGTEILEALQAIYAKPPMSTHSRQIMLLTDGEVSNAAEVIDLVRKNASITRLFSFGIGEGASTSLVKGVARAGRGKAEFVLNDEQTTALVMKTLKCAMQASVTDLHLDWQLGGSPKLVQVPREMPPLFAGDRLIVYAINSGEQTVLNGRVQLKGKIGQREVAFDLNVESNKDTSPVDAALPVHRLAAKAEIKHLQDLEKDEANKCKAEIILLSIAANIVSCHTSMVGVDKDCKEKVTGELIQRRVPLMMSQQSAYYSSGPMLGGMGGGGMPVMMCCRMAPPQHVVCQQLEMVSCNIVLDSEFDSTPVASAQFDMCSDSCVEKASVMPAPVPVISYVSVISLQTFIGCWKLDSHLAALADISLQQLQDLMPVKSADVWATIVALAILVAKFGDKKEEWEMIEMKARQWLASQDLEGRSVEDLLGLASGIFTGNK